MCFVGLGDDRHDIGAAVGERETWALPLVFRDRVKTSSRSVGPAIPSRKGEMVGRWIPDTRKVDVLNRIEYEVMAGLAVRILRECFVQEN